MGAKKGGQDQGQEGEVGQKEQVGERVEAEEG